MPMYRWNGTQWVQYVSTSLTTGTNVYVKTTGTTGGMTTTNSKRVRDIYMHNGTSWAKVYKGFIPAPPSAPTTPGSFAFDSTYVVSTSLINQTMFQWSSVALPAGATSMEYILEIWNSSKTTLLGTVTKTHTSHPVTVKSGIVYIPTEGVTQYYRVKARAYNAIGTYTDSGTSAWKGLKSGTTTASYSATTGAYALKDGVEFNLNLGVAGTDVYKPNVTYLEEAKFFVSQTTQMSPPLISTVGVTGPGEFSVTLDGTNGAASIVQSSYIYTVGRARWEINPTSGWGTTTSYGTIQITVTGTKTTASSIV